MNKERQKKILNIGDKVKMVNCREAKIYGEKVWTVRSETWECCGSNMVLLEGKSGGFDVSCLETVERLGSCE